MNKIGFVVMIICQSAWFSAQAESLTDISSFAKDICDEISDGGEITRKQVEGTLEGKVGGVAKLLGASVGADGKIKVDNTLYKGLPYEKVPSQMADSRDCKKKLAIMLIEERNRITIAKPQTHDAFVQKDKLLRSQKGNRQTETPSNSVTTASDFKFEVEKCTNHKNSMTCFIIVTNQNKDRNLIVYPSTRAFNMDGREYNTSSLSLVDTSGFKMMLSGLPMRLKLIFDTITVGDNIPKLEIMASISKMKHHRFSAVLRNVAVLSE